MPQLDLGNVLEVSAISHALSRAEITAGVTSTSYEHLHTLTDAEEVPIAGASLAPDKVVTQTVTEGKRVEDILPVSAGEDERPTMKKLPSNELWLAAEPAMVD